MLLSRGGAPLLLLAWLKYRLTQSNSRGWVPPAPVARWKSTMRLLQNTHAVPSQASGVADPAHSGWHAATPPHYFLSGGQEAALAEEHGEGSSPSLVPGQRGGSHLIPSEVSRLKTSVAPIQARVPRSRCLKWDAP